MRNKCSSNTDQEVKASQLQNSEELKINHRIKKKLTIVLLMFSFVIVSLCEIMILIELKVLIL